MEEVALTFSADPSDAVFAWDLRSGAVIAKYASVGAATSSSSASSAAATMALTSNTHALLGQHAFIATVPDKPLLMSYLWHQEQPFRKSVVAEKMSCLAASANGQWLIAGAPSGKLYLWLINTGEVVSVWDAHFKAVSSVAFAAGDALVLSGGQDAVINVWLVAQLVAIGAAASAGGGSSMMPQPVASFSAHSLPITSLYVGIGGQQARIASSSLDRTCKVWDLGTKELVCSIMFPEAIVCATCDVAETALFAGSTSGNIYIVDLTAPSYSASSDTAASASAVASASMSFHCSDRVFSGHTKTITSLAVSADGTLLISCSQDTTARVWHIGSGQTIRIFTQHRHAITGCSVMLKRREYLSTGHPRAALEPQAMMRKYAAGQGADTKLQDLPLSLLGTDADTLTQLNAQRHHQDMGFDVDDLPPAVLQESKPIFDPRLEQLEAELEQARAENRKLLAINRKLYSKVVSDSAAQT